MVGGAFLQRHPAASLPFTVACIKGNVHLPKFDLEHFAFGCYLVNLDTLPLSIFVENMVQKYIKKETALTSW